MSSRIAAIVILVCAGVLCAGAETDAAQLTLTNTPEALPRIPREFRAVWVATVANLDWPSAPSLSVSEQKREAIAYLDLIAAQNFNAVIFQVRPHCDAFFPSELEPWSWYLTGEQGRDPGYDPLQFWIDECRRRGLAIHAWMNPYRVSHPAMNGRFSSQSVVARRPDLVRELKQPGYWWLDPGEDDSRDHVIRVVEDVVSRYELDGIHFDDYFYPYESFNNGADFPDDVSWQRYRENSGRLDRGDWRRQRINMFVESVYRTIRRLKPAMVFGISPFGIWRPENPPGIRGKDTYSVLYADSRLWLNNGWVDYFSPQLYWPIGKPAQSFPVLLGWWHGENTHRRHIWPGLATWREEATEIIDQIQIIRGFAPEAPGQIHFRAKFVRDNAGGIRDALAAGPYSSPALLPAMLWLDAIPPDRPLVELLAGGEWGDLTWRTAGSDVAVRWGFYVKSRAGWRYTVLPPAVTSLKSVAQNLDIAVGSVTKLAITAVDHLGNESEPAFFRLAVH